ncbi:carbohydrate-binding module family 12 protein [Infundibulicybe gibba]|nr:carbohydrate-binding module family 12 protein [Infundibulicybe gibba]
MVNQWQPGTQYNYDDVVEYQGHRWKIIQPHRSQGDWAPGPATAALWGQLSDGDQSYGSQPAGQRDQYQQQQPQQQQPQQQQPQYPNLPQSSEKPTHEEKKTHWYDLDDERKKQLEVGGGLLAGAALLGGGYMAYKQHGKNEEEKKAQTWALQNWVDDARQRTELFRRDGPRGPATWILNEGKHIPQGALVVGKEKSWTLYICRAFYEGTVQIGKASDVFKKGAVIGYGHDEIHLGTYEILLGDMRGLQWVSARGRLNVASLGAKPVDGGRDGDGTPLYVAKAPYNGAEHPGKCSEKLDGAFIPYDGTEKHVNEYRVLCYNN